MTQLGLPLPPPIGAQSARHDHPDQTNQPEPETKASCSGRVSHRPSSLLLPPQSGAVNLAARLWSLKIKCNHVGAGFPRPIALITEMGGENPPLRQVTWLHLFLKDH